MGERRRQVLDAIQRAAEPVGVSEIANRIGVHLQVRLRVHRVDRLGPTP